MSRTMSLSDAVSEEVLRELDVEVASAPRRPRVVAVILAYNVERLLEKAQRIKKRELER